MTTDYFDFWGYNYQEQKPFESSNSNKSITFSKRNDKFETWHEARQGDVIFGTWKVTEKGDLINEKYNYEIPKSRLGEEDWISQMMGKKWIDLNTFIKAYWFALERNGIDQLEMKVFGAK